MCSCGYVPVLPHVILDDLTDQRSSLGPGGPRRRDFEGRQEAGPCEDEPSEDPESRGTSRLCADCTRGRSHNQRGQGGFVD
jgi:hypothetical protein